MTDTKRLEAIEKQLEEFKILLPKVLSSTNENLSQFRVAALRKLSKTKKLLDNLIEFIETELITHQEIISENSNVIQFTNLYEERGNSDLGLIVDMLKDIKEGMYDEVN